MPLKAYDCSKPTSIQCKSIPMSNILRKSGFYQVELDLIIICAIDYTVLCASSITAYSPLCVFTEISMRLPTVRGMTITRHYTLRNYTSPCGSRSDVYSSLSLFSSDSCEVLVLLA